MLEPLLQSKTAVVSTERGGLMMDILNLVGFNFGFTSSMIAIVSSAQPVNYIVATAML
ncbi:hypothetical protein [Levilactobacillus brevis]|uniref:hypothetical protein n=1 Tax=Levilactobacillus brevis TaxID=1580 RepID=UPI0021A77404|nr:hypothetical protein [Levilactobacillus brevis]